MNYKKTGFQILSTIALAGSMGGCSVYMAAQQKGVDVNVLATCKTRICIINHDAKPVESTKNKSGQIVNETFQAQVPTGSAARAAMHGVLDVATWGLWEIAGTPIEAVKGEKQAYMIKVTYEPDGNTIKAMQLVN